MKQLTPEGFQRAREFLKHDARPLDRALFAYRFEQASPALAVAELARFQNDDGGCGHALEPDLRTPSSSALATGLALRILGEINCPEAAPLIRGAVRFLDATLDRAARVWRVVPLDTNSFPHAPWWHDEDGKLARTFDGFRIIPRAEILGAFYRLQITADWLDEATEKTVKYIEEIKVLGSGGGDDLVYALYLAETKELPAHYKERLLERIRRAVPSAVTRDPQKWSSYSIPPLKVALTPQAVLFDLVSQDLQRYLDYLIDHQSPEGTWDPVWTWGKAYPDEWELAKREWRGQLTLDTLTALKAFGRIAG
jgi:hypothetical protein